MSGHPDQLDFFREAVFPVRTPVAKIDLSRFRAKLKRAMSRAIRECPYERAEIAARMALYLGVGSISKASLDAYTAESKEGHDISLVRFKAFVRATGAAWLWDELVSDDGLTLLEGDEVRLAEIGYWQQEIEKAQAQFKALKAQHVRLRRGR
jgi:hypothetical protein